MITRHHATIVVDARGMIVACSWCLTLPRLEELNHQYPGTVSHGQCPDCARLLDASLDHGAVQDVERTIEDAQRARRVA